MKSIISILLPMYIAPKQHGQTPAPYSQHSLDKFQRELLVRAGQQPILRTDGLQLLVPDPQHSGLVASRLFRRYDIPFDADNCEHLAEIFGLALKTFDLPAIQVQIDGGGPFKFLTVDHIEEIGAGILSLDQIEE